MIISFYDFDPDEHSETPEHSAFEKLTQIDEATKLGINNNKM